MLVLVEDNTRAGEGMAKRKRTMSDDEIALVRAMLRRKMRNDTIHYYFNRPERLISSGRIAQIKKGKYGADVKEASAEALSAFLAEWEKRSKPLPSFDLESPIDGRMISGMFANLASQWVMIGGETDKVECKKSFRLSPESRFADVIKSIAGLANNKGGYIFFGVADRTFLVEGLSDNAFVSADPAEINRVLASSLDPVPHFKKADIEIGGKTIGVLFIERHQHGPVIALKNISGDVKEGAVYYRYVGETRIIKPAELRQIIALREQRAVSEFSERMMRVAAGSEATLDLETGEVKGKTGAFLIDRDLLPRIQFIREGDFTEKKGSPALKVIGEVEPINFSDRKRAKIIRDNVTPDAVLRNFLRNERVADPIQYIHAHAHCQRKWLPVWYYVNMANASLEQIVDDLRSQVPTHPSSRDAVVNRIQRKESAFKTNVGRPIQICSGFLSGKIFEPNNGVDDLAFANAVMGLSHKIDEIDRLKEILLKSLDRAESDRSSPRRSSIYRAACRLDELLFAPT
jgi:hypothetical protein